MSIYKIITRQHTRVNVSKIDKKLIRKLFDKISNLSPDSKQTIIYYCFDNFINNNDAKADKTFKIDDAREFSSMIHTLFNKQNTIIVVLAYNQYTEEAQSALLKTLEETLSNIYICLIFTPETKLLSTISSRTIAISESSLKKEKNMFYHFSQKFSPNQIIRLQKIIAKSSKFPSAWINDLKKILPKDK